MRRPRVSVTMAVCNVERFLAEALESVLSQCFKDFELIVVDFGSSDSTNAIVASYAGREERMKIFNVPGCGLAEARNAASSHAQGEYLAIMDADDVCLPERLLAQVEYLDTNKDVALLGGAVEWIDAGGRSLGVRSFPTGDQEIRSILEDRFSFCHPSIMMRRSAFEAVGRYRKCMTFAHDYDLAVRITERYRSANLPQVVMKYRIHPHQVSLQKQKQQSLCRMAAQVSREFRRSGKTDPLDGMDQITEGSLVGLGVPERRLRSVLAVDRRNWIRSMVAAGENSAALEAASELLGSNHDGVEPWQIADLRLTMAKLYWREGKFLKSMAMATRAVLMRPIVLGRPLKGLFAQCRGSRTE